MQRKEDQCTVRRHRTDRKHKGSRHIHPNDRNEYEVLKKRRKSADFNERQQNNETLYVTCQ